MAAAAQTSPLRRWKPFFRAFDSIDAAIEAFDPVEFSRREFRTARGDIVERLCDADDDDHAERLCLLLDDVMAESLETLRLLPLMPTVLAKTDLARCVRALHKDHGSERVRVLAGGIVAAWRASVRDDDAKVRNVMPPKLLDRLPQQPKTVDHHHAPDARRTAMQPAKTLEAETSAKKTVEIATKRASDPVAPGTIFRGDRVGPIPEEKIQAAKRKFNQGYREAEDAKRRRLPIKVVAPEMIKQTLKKKHPIMRERSQARCGSSMIKKTVTVTRMAS
ncbi:hypothetical protein ACQ4PT_019800 [Festuca glaucescens]